MNHLETPRMRRVLIVEDDTTMKPMVNAMFSRVDSNIMIDWVTNAHEAKKYLERERMANHENGYDLVLTDVFLPGNVSGIDLLKEIKRNHSNVNVVVTSGSQISSENLASAEDFLPKPINLHAFYRCLGEVMGYEYLPTIRSRQESFKFSPLAEREKSSFGFWVVFLAIVFGLILSKFS